MAEFWIWIAFVSILVTGLTAIGTKLLRDFSRRELEIYCRTQRRRERFSEIHDKAGRVSQSTETVERFAIGMTWVAILASWGQWLEKGHEQVILMVAIVVITMIAITVWIPTTLVRIWSAPLLFRSWFLWKWIDLLIFPLNLIASLIDIVFHRLAGRQRRRSTEEEFEEEIRTIVDEGMRDGLLEEDTREMIEGVIELGDIDVADVMTPRSDVDAIEVNSSWNEMLSFVISVGRTRIPVYEKKIDTIVGVLYVKDLLPELAKGSRAVQRPFRALLREPWFLPSTKKIDELLNEFQRSRRHMAIVVDEYHALAGIVTIEDVLEEIVGEIEDEYDNDVIQSFVLIDDSTAEMEARVHIDEINERMALGLPEDDEYDTIGGFVATQLGHIPKTGEQIQWENAHITVLEASRRRVERVRIKRFLTPVGANGLSK